MRGGLLAAFLRRDWLYETSYRGMLIFQALSIFGSVIIFYAISKLMPADVPELAEYGGSYFAFALVGLAVSDYFNVGLRSFASRLRLAQTTGTLETMLVTQTPPQLTLLYSSVWDFLLATVRLVLAVVLGTLVMGVQFDADLPATVLMALLSLVTFAALGVLTAAVILVVKRGDALVGMLTVAATLFAGTVFPVDLLPSWLRPLAYLFPLYYALDGLRRATLTDASVGQLALNVVVLGGAALVLIPAAHLAVAWAVERNRRDGSLGQH